MAKNFIFDLDGTLLDTLTDLRDAINGAFEAAGIPFRYSKEECRFFIGHGADVFLHKALRDLDGDYHFQKAKKEYMMRYRAYQGRHTKPFPDMLETLQKLKNGGNSLFVCTNKPDSFAIEIVSKMFGNDLFRAVRGIREGEEPKPNPAIVDYFVSSFGLERKDCLFVGDSDVDRDTAKNASLPFYLCLWGYGDYNEGLTKSAEMCLNEPKDLLKVIHGTF